MFAFLKKERTTLLDSKVQSNGFLRFCTNHGALVFFYGIFLFLFEIKSLRNTITVVHFPLIAWAGLLAVYDIFVRRLWEKLPLWKPLFVFAVLAGVTALVNYETGLVSNIKSWVMVTLPLLSFLPLCLLCRKEDREKSLLSALAGAAVVIFIASLVALVMFHLRISTVIEVFGVNYPAGIRYYIPDDPSSGILLFGIYEDTNHAAAYAIVFAVYSLWLLSACRRNVFAGWKRRVIAVFAWVNLVVQICYFPLANSRGGWLCLAVAAAACLLLYTFCTRFRSRKLWKRSLLSVAATALALVVLLGGLMLVRTGNSVVSRLVSTETSVIETTEPDVVPENADKKPAERPTLQDVFQKSDQTAGSGRIILWKEAMELYPKNPILGTGPDNGQYYAEQHNVGCWLRKGTSIHNSYLDLLVEYGLLGTLAMLSFLFGCAVLILRRIFKHREGVPAQEYFAVFCALFVAGVSALLTCIFVSTTAMYFLLLCFLGFALACCGDKHEKLLDSAQ